MDSLSKMLNRLRPNDSSFKERFIAITSVYSAPFDSDTVEMYLEEGTLRQEEHMDGLVYIPCIEYSLTEEVYIMPNAIIIGDESVPFPETIEEFRSMCLAHGVRIELNTITAQNLFG